MHNGNHAFFRHIRHERARFFDFGNLRMRIVRSDGLSPGDDILIQVRLPRMSREFDVGNGRRMGFRDDGSRFQFRKCVNRLLAVLGRDRLGKSSIAYALAVRARGHWQKNMTGVRFVLGDNARCGFDCARRVLILIGHSLKPKNPASFFGGTHVRLSLGSLDSFAIGKWAVIISRYLLSVLR